jgi:hypothetical protein
MKIIPTPAPSPKGEPGEAVPSVDALAGVDLEGLAPLPEFLSFSPPSIGEREIRAVEKIGRAHV